MLIILMAGCAYLGLGSLLYINARLSKALIRSSSFYTLEDGTKATAMHYISPGEYRLDGYVYQHLLYPFVQGEVAYWYVIAPEGSPYLPDSPF
ncbi:MAG: hypothetical protein AAFZ80_13995 [Cyanobacteria bacterium P01_A01_bin.105]